MKWDSDAASVWQRHKAGGVIHRTAVLFVAGCLLGVSLAPSSARAENQMGYQLLSPQDAASLPRNQGSLGMDIERSQQITDGGMTFDIIRVKQVRRGSPGARAGFGPGDQIIAIDGRVFPSLAAFAAYVGSVPPGTAASVDYIPAGGGPAQAQRVSVTVGAVGGLAQQSSQQAPAPVSTSMSTETKVAIGVGAAALLGCYEMGCFSKRRPASAVNGRAPFQHAGSRPQTAYQPQSGFNQQPGPQR